MAIEKLTKREQDVMEILWHAHHQMSASEIQEASDDVSIYTVQQVLRRLLEMKYIEVSGFGQHVKVLMRYYVPLISEADYIGSFMDDSTAEQVSENFIRKTEDREVLGELKKQIVEREKELKK